MRILLFPNSNQSPSSRFRVWQFVEPLRKAGHEVTVRVPLLGRTWEPRRRWPFLAQAFSYIGSSVRLLSATACLRDASEFDVILMNRDLVPEVRIEWLEPWLARRNPRLIFDFDDAIFLGPREAKLRRILPCFAHITAGNEYLAEFAAQFNPRVSVWPTVVDTDIYRPVVVRQPGPIRLGWTGSNQTLQRYVPLLKDPLCKLAQLEKFEFVITADVPPDLNWPGVKIRYLRWCPVGEVQNAQLMDIGLMPLCDGKFEMGKCGLKAIMYMAIGVPALVSPVGVNRAIVLDGVSGFHCANDDEWFEKARLLMHDGALRRRMGEAGRSRVTQHYSIQSLLPRMSSLFEAVARE